MKKLILAAVLATLAGSTAFAQSYDSEFGTANIAPVNTPANPDRAFAYRPNDRSRATSAYAQAPGSTAMRAPRRMIGFDGAVEGDPDPNIRFQLHREQHESW